MFAAGTRADALQELDTPASALPHNTALQMVCATKTGPMSPAEADVAKLLG